MTKQTVKAIEVEADSLEEAKRLVRAQVPEGLQLLSEKVVSDGKPKTVTATADTVEAALEKARGKVPGDAAVLETKVVAEPGEEVVGAEAFSEEEAKAAMKKELKTGAQLRSVRLVVPGKKGFFGIGKTPNQYEGEVCQQAVVKLTHTTRAKIAAQIGKSPKVGLAAEAERWGPAPSGSCDICNDTLGSGSPGTVRVPNAQFKKVVELGYNPASSGRAGAALALSRALGTAASPSQWYETWKKWVFRDTTDWGLCRACADDVRRFLAG